MTGSLEGRTIDADAVQHQGAMDTSGGGRRDTEELVGRRTVRDHLAVLASSARAGASRLVLLPGDPGIGKTALARWLANAWAVDGMVLWGMGWDGEGTPPYRPWVEALRCCLNVVSVADREQLFEPGGVLATLLPELADVPQSLLASAAGGGGARFRLFDAVATLLTNLAERAPVLVVLDDLQWADPSTLELLRFLATRLRSERLLLLGAYRDVEITAVHPLRQPLADLRAIADVVPVVGVDRNAVGDILQAVIGTSLEDDVIDIAFRRTGGNPFFLREVGTLIAASGAHAAVTSGLIPDGVRAVVERRVARLSQACHSLLGVAAVVGQVADPALLAEAAALSEATVFQLLEEAQLARVLEREAVRSAPVSFAHDLFRETLCEQLPATVRSELHNRVGLALERQAAAGLDVAPSELAHHFLRADGEAARVRSIRYSLDASREALVRLAAPEAQAHAERALGAIEKGHQQDEPDRQTALLLLGEAAWKAGDVEKARHAYARATSLARRASDPEALGRVALGVHMMGADYATSGEAMTALLQDAVDALPDGSDVIRARLLAALARQRYHHHGRREDAAQAKPLAADAVAIAERSGDPSALAFALFAQHDAEWQPGTAARRLEISSRMESVARAAGDAEACAEAVLLMAIARLELGDPGAIAELERYSRLALSLRAPHFHYLALTRRVTVASMQGELELAERLLDEASLLGEAVDEPDKWHVETAELWALRTLQERRSELEERVRSWPYHVYVPLYRAKLVLSLVAKGADVEAAATMELLENFEPSTEPFHNIWLPELATVAEAACALRRRRLAGRLYDALLPFAGLGVVTAGAVDFYGAVDHYLGLLALTLGRPDLARTHLQAAASLHHRIGATAWAVRSRSAMAGLEAVPDGSNAQMSGEFRRDGDVWTLSFEERRVNMRDAKGLHDIAALLAVPGRSVRVADLIGLTSGHAAEEEAVLGADPVLDQQARAEYRARLRELEGELADAERDNDLERVARTRLERQMLAEELSAALGLGGRERLLGAGQERARKAVTARIHNSLKRIEERHAELGAHLAASITTGASCSYTPSRPVRWAL